MARATSLRPLLAATVVVAALSGCSFSPSADSAPAVSASSSGSATASPTPTPTPTRPAVTALTIGPDGIGSGGPGDLRIGEPVPAAADALALVHWDPNACDTSGAAWVASYPDVAPGQWGGTAPFGINTDGQVQTAPILFILVTAPTVGTASGVHVGSTRAEVLAAYPTGLTKFSGGLSDVYWVTDSRGRLQIELPYGASGAAQDDDVVAALSVTAASGAPFALAGGDGGAPCSA